MKKIFCIVILLISLSPLYQTNQTSYQNNELAGEEFPPIFKPASKGEEFPPIFKPASKNNLI